MVANDVPQPCYSGRPHPSQSLQWSPWQNVASLQSLRPKPDIGVLFCRRADKRTPQSAFSPRDSWKKASISVTSNFHPTFQNPLCLLQGRSSSVAIHLWTHGFHALHGRHLSEIKVALVSVQKTRKGTWNKKWPCDRDQRLVSCLSFNGSKECIWHDVL